MADNTIHIDMLQQETVPVGWGWKILCFLQMSLTVQPTVRIQVHELACELLLRTFCSNLGGSAVDLITISSMAPEAAAGERMDEGN